MSGKPHNGYSSYRAWETALYFDNDHNAYTTAKQILDYNAQRYTNPENAIYNATKSLCRIYRGEMIPDTRHPISKRSIREYVAGEMAERYNRPDLCKVYD